MTSQFLLSYGVKRQRFCCEKCLLFALSADLFFRNNHGYTALTLLRRRGVEKEAISLLEPYEEDEVIGL